MKKLLLYVFVLLTFLPGFSQSLEVFYNGILLEEDGSIMVATHPDSSSITLHGIEVKNNSSNPISTNCIRQNIDTATGTLNSYCWGLCYGPDTDTSFVQVTINGLSSTGEFEGDYIHNGISGTSKIKYTFYDFNNPDDKFSFFVNYNVTTALDVNESKALIKLSFAYPNPANIEANIDYKMVPFQGSKQICVYNLLGAKIKSYDLTENEGTISIDTSTLNEGIYFYSLLINNEAKITQKLIIKH